MSNSSGVPLPVPPTGKHPHVHHSSRSSSQRTPTTTTATTSVVSGSQPSSRQASVAPTPNEPVSVSVSPQETVPNAALTVPPAVQFVEEVIESVSSPQAQQVTQVVEAAAVKVGISPARAITIAICVSIIVSLASVIGTYLKFSKSSCAICLLDLYVRL